MGNVLRFKCVNCANADQRQRRKMTVLLIGLDNAGKTCILKSILREKQKNVLPTIGFSSSSFRHRDNDITIYDLGGHKQIRDIWNQYFADVHGVVFVVDSTDHRRLDECRDVFTNVLKHDKIAGKPVLLLGNKQDKHGALDELDIVDRLNVEAVVNINKCPTLVETCTALHMAPIHYCSAAFVDPCIDSGFNWLVSQIVKQYSALNARVTQDVAHYKADVDRKIQEWKKKQETSNDSYLLSFNAPHRRSTKRNPFRHITRVIDSFESKTQNPAEDMGSTSFIIPLREETPEPAPVAFRNKVKPAVVQSASARSPEPGPRPGRSRSPLFRALSKESERGQGEASTSSLHVAPAVVGSDRLPKEESFTAKMKRSVFSRSNSAGGKSSTSVHRRPSSARSLKKNFKGPGAGTTLEKTLNEPEVVVRRQNLQMTETATRLPEISSHM
ncbi:ADP-ribosylation factor-like protein 13B [Adelges cooleyi]|uniref:ADP-ribosylation factor-like protein 13B n=1 Tax=Adelges cooleyi TaxID=133065 RepID=UPI0021800DB3|nr:ADP-ribosylation factor-like protein 13B [Adelges cooleyi]